jgi:hypothetical protein
LLTMGYSPPRSDDCWQDLLGNRGAGVKLDLGTC